MNRGKPNKAKSNKVKPNKVKRNILIKYPVVLIVFTLLLGSTAWGQQRYMLNDAKSNKFKMAKKLFDKGKLLLSEKKLDRAERAFKGCLELFPEYSHSAYHLGQIYYKRKSYKKALDYIELAKKHYDYIATFGVNSQLEYFASLREQKYNLDREVVDMQQRLDRKDFRGKGEVDSYPEIVELKTKIAHGKETLRRIDELLRAPQPVKAGVPADYFYLHGNVFFKMKKYQEAYIQYLEAVKVEPCYVDAYKNLANLNFIGRRYNEALLYIEKAEKCGSEVDGNLKKIVLKALGKI